MFRITASLTAAALCGIVSSMGLSSCFRHHRVTTASGHYCEGVRTTFWKMTAMKKLLLLLLPTVLLAQSVPNGGTINTGQVWTTAQWVAAWQSKADTVSPSFTGTPLINGVPIPTFGPGSPTSQIGLTAIPGIANSFMRSDAAQALNVGVSPTWTGNHTFSAVGGTPVTIGGQSIDALQVEGVVGAVPATFDAGRILNIFNNSTAGADKRILSFGQISGNAFIRPLFSGAGPSPAGLLVAAGPNGTLFDSLGGVTIGTPSGGSTFTVSATGSSTPGTSVYVSQSTGAFFSSASAAGTTGLIMNSAGGSNYGQIGTPANQTWALGYGASQSVFGTPALTWNATGNVVIPAPASGQAITVNGLNNNYGFEVIGGATSGQSYGVLIEAGTTSADEALAVLNQTGATPLFRVFGDGGIVVGNPAGVDMGPGTLNMQGCFINGVACGTGGGGGGSGANPSASIGLSAINGSATTFMRSDAAPPLSQAISPTWTGNHIFSPSSGTAITAFATSGNSAIVAAASGATPAIEAIGQSGTNGAAVELAQSTVSAWTIYNAATTGGLRFFDGSADRLRIALGGGVSITAPTSGNALSISGLNGTYAQSISVGTSSIFAGGGLLIGAPNTASQSNGMRIIAGTNTSDSQLILTNAANTANYWIFDGSGALYSNGLTSQGQGTINMAGCFVNGAACLTSAGAAAAGSLTGTTLASNVVNSSLTGLGAVTSGSFPAANLSGGTLASGVTASSLTSVGVLTGLTVSGAAAFNTSVNTPSLFQNSQPVYAGIPQNPQSTSYTLVLSDANKHIYVTTTASGVITIPSNASVPFSIGTAITIINDSAAPISIPITSDAMVLSPGGNTSTRTLAIFGEATLIKVQSTRWYISGTGLTRLIEAPRPHFLDSLDAANTVMSRAA